MNKLSFRARQLDHFKAMPVLRAQEIPDLPDFAAINRAVPIMPTGMEKEEETVNGRHFELVSLGFFSKCNDNDYNECLLAFIYALAFHIP